MLNKNNALYKYAANKPKASDTAGALAGAVGGGLGIPLLSTAYTVTPGMIRPAGDTLTPIDDNKIINYMQRTGKKLMYRDGSGSLLFKDLNSDHNTVVNYTPEDPAPNTIPNYYPSIMDTYAVPDVGNDTSYIHLGPYTRVPILAHEYGHTEQPSDVLVAANHIRDYVPGIGSAATAFSLANGDRKAARNVAAASSLLGLGMVLPEVHASYLGSQHLDTLGEKLEAFSGNPTYVLNAAAPAATYFIGSSLADYINKNKKKKGN